MGLFDWLTRRSAPPSQPRDTPELDGFVHAPDASPDGEAASTARRKERALFGGLPTPWWAPGQGGEAKPGSGHHGGPASHGGGHYGGHHGGGDHGGAGHDGAGGHHG